MTEKHESLVAALAALQGELPSVRKDKTAKVKSERTGSEYSYPYADLADIAEAIHPLMSKHGLAFTAAPRFREDGKYVLVGELLHVSGDSKQGEFPLPLGKPQEIGSAYTYGRRYLLCGLTGVVADRDDDGKAAAEAPPPKRQRKPAEKPAADNFASSPQLAKMHLLFNANGLKDRDERLAFTAGLIKRDLTTSAELTKDEASRLIDHLEHLAEDTRA